MIVFLTVLLVIVALLIAGAVLLQPSKADSGLGGLAASAGGDSALGVSGNDFLEKGTWILFAIFVILCLSLAKVTGAEYQEKQDKLDVKSSLETQVDVKKDAGEVLPTEEATVKPAPAPEKAPEPAAK